MPYEGMFKRRARAGRTLAYGVWHAYKNVCIMFFRRYLPILAWLMNKEVNTEMKLYSFPKLITIEKLIAGPMVNRSAVKTLLADRIILRAPLGTLSWVGCRALRALRDWVPPQGGQ